MKSLLNWPAPLLLLLAVIAVLKAWPIVWPTALACLLCAGWSVQAGARAVPAAISAALSVMVLLWAYGALAFLLILTVVVAVASLWRFDQA
jgi:hypothetical protein